MQQVQAIGSSVVHSVAGGAAFFPKMTIFQMQQFPSYIRAICNVNRGEVTVYNFFHSPSRINFFTYSLGGLTAIPPLTSNSESSLLSPT